MAEAFIGLGSNVGNKQGYLEFAIDQLAGAGTVMRVSSFHDTDPVGFLEQDRFLNAVVHLDTGLTPDALLEYLLAIEGMAGRQRNVRNGPRTLDLDILLYGQLVVDEPGLTIPHPRMHERMFVLDPLCELASAATHPVLNRTMAELKASLVE